MDRPVRNMMKAPLERMSEALAGVTIAKRQRAEEGRMDPSENEKDRIRLEAVSFETPTEPRVTYGLELPDGESVSVEVTVALPEGSVVFRSYDQIIELAWLELSRWLDAMSRHARTRGPFAG